jgi:hypothetical protein
MFNFPTRRHERVGQRVQKNIGDQRGASDSAWRQARKGEAQGERSRIDDVDGFSKGDPNFEKEK